MASSAPGSRPHPKRTGENGHAQSGVAAAAVRAANRERSGAAPDVSPATRELRYVQELVRGTRSAGDRTPR